MIRRPPRSTLFPYTTLFRSRASGQAEVKNSLILGNELGLVAAQGGAITSRFNDVHGNDRGNYQGVEPGDRKSTRLNSSHANISYAVFCLKKNKSIIRDNQHM